eukprot:CAMPEP_0115846564 /NCGR_PEP_ID=MMETSP0287-20121206/9925_1 /TAXON_ID=412157 /ORGANISM="Chrysochromulina rotalis, Strain UIO044" /LENGTH=142 /DNA_ID=CAMNT_0003300357 /DNA_START=50 /DNA_END=478 /DNA_ORIENTATION=-
MTTINHQPDLVGLQPTTWTQSFRVVQVAYQDDTLGISGTGLLRLRGGSPPYARSMIVNASLTCPPVPKPIRPPFSPSDTVQSATVLTSYVQLAKRPRPSTDLSSTNRAQSLKLSQMDEERLALAIEHALANGRATVVAQECA